MSTSPSFRVFLSSTFRDFDRERDVMRRVEMALRERLRPLGGSITLVDLRWGVFTEGEEGARELDILRVCLDEIERTRPLFVGLLGDRYGWVPDAAVMRSVAAHRGLADEVAGRSVTELEIAYGVFSDDVARARSIFFLREFVPGPPPGLADPPGSTEARALQRLKDRLAAEATRLVSYQVDAGWGPDALTSFEELAIESLWDMIVPELASAAEPMDQIQASFRHEIGRGFVADDDLLASIEADLGRGAGTFTVLGGAPGSGKSATLVALADRAEARGADVVFHSFGLGTTAGRSILLDRLERHAGVPAGAVLPPPRARAALLALHQRGRPVLLCLDALDAGADDADRSLAWLPDPLPGWVDVVATSATWPSTSTRRVRHRRVEELGVAQAAAVVRGRFDEQGKRATADLVAEIVTKPARRSRASGSPLWTVLAADLVAGLDVVDFARLDGLPGDAEDRLRALVADAAATLPGEIEELYRELIARSRRSLDGDLVDAILRTIAVVRNGIPSRELLEVCSAILRRPVTDLDLARVRWALRGQVAELGAGGEIDVLHGPMRGAVLDGWDERDLDRWRGLVADALHDLREGSAFAATESLALLMACGRIDDVASWWEHADVVARDGAPRVVALSLVADEEAAPARVAALVAASRSTELAELAIASLEYLVERAWAGTTLGAAAVAVASAISARSLAEPSDERWIELRSSIVQLRLRIEDSKDSPETWRELVRIDRRLVDLDPDDVTRLGNLGRSLAAVAAAESRAGGKERARGACAEAVAISDHLASFGRDRATRFRCAEIRASAARTLQRCGDAVSADRAAEGALREFQALEGAAESLHAFWPSFASALQHGAAIAHDRGDHARAKALVGRAVEIADDLVAAEPFHLEILDRSAQVHRSAADIARSSGEPTVAAHHLRLALARRESICRALPTSTSAVIDVVLAIADSVAATSARGDGAEAREGAERGLRLCRQLDGLDVDRQLVDAVHRRLLCTMADLEANAHNHPAARAHAARALELGRRWAQRHPADPEALGGAASAAQEACFVALRAMRHPDAWARATECISLRERIIDLLPGSTRALQNLAVALAYQADAATGWGRPDLAIEPLSRAVRIHDGLRELDPADIGLLGRWAEAMGKLGSVEIELDRWDDALGHLRAARRVFEHLGALDPANTEAYWQLAWVHRRSGVALRALGDLVGGRDAFRRAADLYERLHALDPSEELSGYLRDLHRDLAD